MLWSLEDVAENSRYSLTVAKRIVAQPDFPKPVKLWNGAHPRWVREEVEQWILARKEAA